VVVVFRFHTSGIPQMEQAVVLQQIASFLVTIFHNCPPCAGSAYIIAQIEWYLQVLRNIIKKEKQKAKKYETR
jgi:hypothetical protein